MDLLESVFGIQVQYGKWEKQSALPLYISADYEFQTATLNDCRCIILTPKAELVTLPALKKQIKKIQELDNAPVVLNLQSISFYRKKNMIENKIPFITSKQVYLPFMGTLLTKENDESKETEKFMFSTQQLVLLYLYSNKQKLYISEATEKLPYTAMTLSRAVKQLESVNLFDVTKDGVNRVIESKYSKNKLYEKIKGYLSTPVRTSGYIEKTKLTEDMVIAGETALARTTMLNPRRVKTYAVYSKAFDKKLLMNELVDPENQARIEVWEYDPKKFSKDDMADALSIALSFLGNEDERIEEAVDELVESVWVK